MPAVLEAASLEVELCWCSTPAVCVFLARCGHPQPPAWLSPSRHPCRPMTPGRDTNKQETEYTGVGNDNRCVEQPNRLDPTQPGTPAVAAASGLVPSASARSRCFSFAKSWICRQEQMSHGSMRCNALLQSIVKQLESMPVQNPQRRQKLAVRA